MEPNNFTCSVVNKWASYSLPEKLSSNNSIAFSTVAHQVRKSIGLGNSVAANGLTYTSRLFHACADRKVFDYASVVKGP